MGIYLILPTLMIILFFFLIVRAGAIALMMTGMDQRRARFQALSLFSGTGFTTREAETIVNHPQRRQIATWLMILGNAGIVTVIVTATSSLVTS
jgi:Trk-type K+ transport system membrane component